MSRKQRRADSGKMTNASPTRADRPLQSAPGVCLTDAAPISFHRVAMKTHLQELLGSALDQLLAGTEAVRPRSEEHTSELQSLMRSSYAVFCLKKNIQHQTHTTTPTT